MQNVAQGSGADSPKIEKVNVHHRDIGNSPSSAPQSSSNSSPAKSETETYSDRREYMTESSESEEDSVSEVESFVVDTEFEEESQVEDPKYLLNSQSRNVNPETQKRLEVLLQAAGISQLATKDGKHLADPDVLRRLTTSVSSALDEAAAALTRMRSDTSAQPEKTTSLVEACTDGDVGTVRKLLTEGGRSVHETSEDGESLLSLACSAGYFELAQVLLAMHANVEDRGIKGECTPLMEAASAGHLDIVRLLVAHGADVNAQSTSGNTPLMYGCAGGHEDVVKYLLENGANVEDHNENGHTPLMEAASAGHVGLAKILLQHGAGINTHSNEFKESALTLACYKGHLDMVKFLLEAGADQEHKTDEMHTALMEASMDGHVEVARLLLDSGAQVNMPTDSFESPLTLAACGGHVDLALLLIERGANIEEVNDEGYTPLMEAAREGHEDMVALLLSQGANINAQTDETQETALTLACCGGFTEVADFLNKAGADLELGASTPLMEASQEGHLELVKYLLENNASVYAQTQTGDTALTYACENGHTDVADLLLQYGADLEHESEGGRTPLMKACRAGHHCTVQFLISKGANVCRQTSNNDHTPLSLACAGGHLVVVEYLLANNADPNHKLKDNSTMLIEAAKGGHTTVVQLLLDYPHSIMLNQPGGGVTAATNLNMLPGHVGNRDSPMPSAHPHRMNFFPQTSVLQEVPEAVRIVPHEEGGAADNKQQRLQTQSPSRMIEQALIKEGNLASKSNARAGAGAVFDANLTTAEAQQVRTQPLSLSDLDECEMYAATATMEFLAKQGPGFIENVDHKNKKMNILDYVKNRKKLNSNNSAATSNNLTPSSPTIDEGSSQKKQQIFEELQRVGREYNYKLNQQQPGQKITPVFQDSSSRGSLSDNNQLIGCPAPVQAPEGCREEAATDEKALTTTLPVSPYPSDVSRMQVVPSVAFQAGYQAGLLQKHQQTMYFAPIAAPQATTSSGGASAITQPVKSQTVSSHSEVSQNTAISDRPKAKPVSKKEGKSMRKLNNASGGPLAQSGIVDPLHVPMPALQAEPAESDNNKSIYPFDLDALGQLTSDDPSDNLLTASILQQFHNSSQLQAAFASSPLTDPIKSGGCQQGGGGKNNDCRTMDLEDGLNVGDLECYNINDVTLEQADVNTYAEALDENIIASLGVQPDDADQVDVTRVEYFAVPTNGAALPPAQGAASGSKIDRKDSSSLCHTGFKGKFNFVPTIGTSQPNCAHSQQCIDHSTVHPHYEDVSTMVQTSHHCQVPCTQHSNQVQAATQTSQATLASAENKKVVKSTATQDNNSQAAKKKGRFMFRHQQQVNNIQFQHNQNFQIDPNSAAQYGVNPVASCVGSVPPLNYCMDVDSETESNHDTALTLACAGGHEELVELLISRGADIEHRDKKGFTPLILAATAGHEKVVDILLKNNADIEAQSERTKDTPLSLACSGGRYEVVEILLKNNANKEHRNVSDYTPLSLAASGGYVNIIKLLLNHGAEINSRTGSKLGISPLMLAAMNGHTAAVKLLLDMGSDINAQIETNRNTALTLACFQGRHEVVSLLLDRRANVEHRAKTGLTPLMEAASGGYVEVGRVLLDKGADVNATPVPSSRDTALTIAADKGHIRFVELLLCRGASVEVKNKKGNSPLWLAANGGHLSVVELLHNLSADIDSQDNRKVSCLMAAYRKGHVKVVKWMVNHVNQFPSDQEMIRYIATVSDKDLLDKCHECIKVIRAAKDTQAAKANKNASILLEELDMEKNREESKKAAAARRRERKKKKKLEKKEEKRKLTKENKKNELFDDEEKDEDEDRDEENNDPNPVNPQNNAATVEKEEGDSGIDANSQGSCSSNDVKSKEKRKDKKKKKNANTASSLTTAETTTNKEKPSVPPVLPTPPAPTKSESNNKVEEKKGLQSARRATNNVAATSNRLSLDRRVPPELETATSETPTVVKKKESDGFKSSSSSATSPKQPGGKREDGWKEVVRKSSVQPAAAAAAAAATIESGIKKVSVPLNAISRVIGRGGSNINAIRGATGAHIEVEKQTKGQGERTITIKGSAEASKQAHYLISVLIKDPDVDILSLVPKAKPAITGTSLWDKTQIGTKKVVGKALAQSASTARVPLMNHPPANAPVSQPAAPKSASNAPKTRPSTIGTSAPRITAPRLLAADKEKSTPLRTTAPSSAPSRSTKALSSTATSSSSTITTFASKLLDAPTAQNANNVPLQILTQLKQPRLSVPQTNAAAPISPSANNQVSNQCSPKHNPRPIPTSSAPPNMQHYPPNPAKSFASSVPVASANADQALSQPCSPTPVSINSSKLNNKEEVIPVAAPAYSLFNSGTKPQSMWGGNRENESQKPINFAAVTGGGGHANAMTQPAKIVEPQEGGNTVVDASKAPGYRGPGSPVSSKTSSNSTTPPNLPIYQSNFDKVHPQPLPPIGSNLHNRSAQHGGGGPNQNEMPPNLYYESGLPSMVAHSDSNLYKGAASSNYSEASSMVAPHGSLLQTFNRMEYPQSHQQQQQQPNNNVTMSRLNPRAPDFMNKNQMCNGYSDAGNLYLANKSDSLANQFQNSNPVSWHNMPIGPIPQPFELSRIAGMSIQTIQTEIFNDAPEALNTSPNMSPKYPMSNYQLPDTQYTMDSSERNKPPPIGTERARSQKSYNSSMDNNSWMSGGQGDKHNNARPHSWQMGGSHGSVERSNLFRLSSEDELNFNPYAAMQPPRQTTMPHYMTYGQQDMPMGLDAMPQWTMLNNSSCDMHDKQQPHINNTPWPGVMKFQ